METGWSGGFTEVNNSIILQQLLNRENPTSDRFTRRKMAEELISYMSTVVFPGKDVKTFRVLLDVLDN
jgi:hypothetical protein